jgi:hypothetical protein
MSEEMQAEAVEEAPQVAQEQQEVTAIAEDNNAIAEQQEQPQEAGEPEAPEWFMKDKYKSIDEQARAAFELQKKMGKYWGSPQENYSIDDIEGLDADDPILEGMAPAIKEMGLSQEGFNQLVKSYFDATTGMAKKVEAELKKTLTTEDALTYKACDKWMNENLSQEEIQHVQNNWLMTPSDFKLFNQMRLMAAPSSNVPSPNDGQVAKFESSREVENDKIKYLKEVKSGMRVKDKNYEDELAMRFRDAKGRELRSQR